MPTIYDNMQDVTSSREKWEREEEKITFYN